MCPPVSERPGREGVSCLYAAWRYQLLHGDELSVCFTCFKVAFQDLRDTLGLEDVEDEDWDPESMGLPEAGPEQGELPGPSEGQGPGQPAHEGPGALAPAPAESEEMEIGLDHQFVPTELGPQDVVPLGPQEADWTQGLPWRFGGLPPCSHWPSPSTPQQEVIRVALPPAEPLVLELGVSQTVDPDDAKSWLLNLQVMCVEGSFDALYLRNMVPWRALGIPGQRWAMLLVPREAWGLKLQGELQQLDLSPWRLSVLESTGHGMELVPADWALQKWGFTLISHSPWSQIRPAEEYSAFQPPSFPGQGSGTPETGSSGPSEPLERLAIAEALVLGEPPCFPPLSPGPQN